MIKVGILGTGGMGKTHARQYAKIPEVSLIFYDRDPQRAAEFQQLTGGESAPDADRVIRECDVLDVCLPTHLHLEYASLGLRAGKPVFCEKPMCRTTAECAELVELSEKTGTPLMPAQVVRYFPEFRTAHRLVQDGKVGLPAAIRTRRGGRFPKGSADWFSDFALSGGVILDLMIHDLDWIRWTFGEVERVFCQSLTFTGIKEKDYALATLTLASGALAHVEATWADPGGFRVTFEVCGSDGMIEFDSRLYPTLRTTTEAASVSESPLAPTDDPYYREIREFLDAVASGSPPPVSGLDGLRAVALAEAAIESARTGKAVTPGRG